MEAELRGRRIKAARMLAGLDATEDLAEHVDMGATTLRKMERGERPSPPHELREIAKACSLPYEFFTIDFATLSEDEPDLRTKVDAIDRTLTRVERRLAVLERHDEQRDPEAPPGTPDTGDPR